MKSKSSTILEYITSIAVVAVATVVLITYFTRAHVSSLPDQAYALRGTHIDLTKFKATPAKLNIVLALSTACHFCEEDTDLYRDLSQIRATGQTRLFAVFPQKATEATLYLDQHGIRTDAVQSSSLSDYKVHATPTILLVDASGNVTDAWVGSLEESQKSKVLDQVRKASTNM
jgi:thioredoxin-related protein